VKLSGFQYHLPRDYEDSHHDHSEHYGISYREIMADASESPENKKYTHR
jgi:hypothetical protein